MKKFILGLVALLATASTFAATTYTFTGPVYTSATGAFNTTMHLTGSFTTATPLAPNLPPNMPLTDITGQVTSYSFFDGVNSYNSTDANARVLSFGVGTDASGIMNRWDVTLQIWESGTSPHSPGDLASWVVISSSPPGTPTLGVSAFDTLQCTQVGTSPSSGVADACLGGIDVSVTGIATSAPGFWTQQTAATSIPTLSELGIIILSSLLVLGTILTLRGQRQ